MGSDLQRNPNYQAEMQYLADVLAYLRSYSERISGQREDIDKSVRYSRKHFNSDNTEQYTELVINMSRQEWLAQKVKMSSTSLKKPYFARVDFTATDEKKLQELYIGKMSLIRDEDDYPLIIDWRAPVSNLYYEGRLGEASYDCPDGLIEGEISLKRQYIIENGAMQDFFDIDVTASDEFLQIALGSSKDKRLKDIVSTIQAEQNRVIRADMIKPLVVQGAAGGGKTTIALHRIAYLLYNFESRITPKNIMILAPNRFFLSYISEVLPDLGVENVFQTTFDDFACEFVDEKLKIKPANEKLSYVIENPAYAEGVCRISEVKSSLVFKKVIDNYMNYITLGMVSKEDFMLGQYVIMEYRLIKRMLTKDYAFLPAVKRIKEIKKYLVTALADKKKTILRKLNADYDFRVGLVKDEMPEDCEERRRQITEILGERDSIIDKLQKQSKVVVKNYLKVAKMKKSSQYYKELILDAPLFAEMSRGFWNEKGMETLRKMSEKVIMAGSFEEEDVAPIMHIHYGLQGNEYFDLRHIVIDEAQDVSLFQLHTLREIMNTDSFTILGDLCQGIYSYKGITDWAQVSDKIFAGKAVYYTLEQSYRTTVEIMDFANIVMGKLKLEGIPLAKPVIRHGNAVAAVVLDDLDSAAKRIQGDVKQFKGEGHKSIAVICKTLDECYTLKEKLNLPELGIVDGKESEYTGGTVILPVALSKGLEFDAVIVANASLDQYSLTDIDIKLLYIAITRALHELKVYSVGELTRLLA